MSSRALNPRVFGSVIGSTAWDSGGVWPSHRHGNSKPNKPTVDADQDTAGHSLNEKVDVARQSVALVFDLRP